MAGGTRRLHRAPVGAWMERGAAVSERGTLGQLARLTVRDAISTARAAVRDLETLEAECDVGDAMDCLSTCIEQLDHAARQCREAFTQETRRL